MVYIDRNGRVWQNRPWDWQRVVEIFVGLWYLLLQFFKTLLSPFTGGNGKNHRGGSGWGSGGGGGGGGGGGRGGGGGGFRTNTRIGRIQQQSVDSSACSMGGG